MTVQKTSSALITGHGGGKSGDTAPSYYQQPDTISSHATLRMIMALAAGPVEGLAEGAASILFDGVPLTAGNDGTENFTGITWQITHGTADQSPIGLEGFNAIEQTVHVNQLLQHQVPVQRSGSAEAARLTFRFPRGLVNQNEAGIFGARVDILIERRQPDGTWQEAKTLVVAEKQAAVFELQVLVPFDPVAADDHGPAIRVTRLTNTSSDPAHRDGVELLAVTWLHWEKLTYPGVSTMGVSFDANSFSGRVPRISVELKGRLIRIPVNYDPVTRTSAGLWNGQFKSAWSNNPAWVLLDMLTDSDWGLGLDDRLIEVFDLHAIAAYCDMEVDNGRGDMEPRFLFDAAITRRLSAVDLIGQVCAAILVHTFWSGGRMRFIQDSPADPVMVLTNAMVEDGVFVYSGPGLTAGFSHALVTYNDPAGDHGISVEAEVNPAFFSRHGYRAREVSLLGCRRRSQARRHARWLVETARRDLYGLSWHASLDHFAENPVRPGDIIRVFDQNRIDGKAYPGRSVVHENTVLSVEVHIPDAEDLSTAFLDYEGVTAVWHEGVAVTLDRLADGLFDVTPISGDWVDLPQPGGAMLIRLGSTAEQGVNYRVIQLRELDRHRLEVSAVRHDPEIYDRVDSGYSLDDAPSDDRPLFRDPLPVAADVIIHQPVSLPHGGNGRDLHVSWHAALDSRVAIWRLYASGPDAETRREDVSRPPLILRDLAVGDWTLRLRAVDWSGREGPEATASYTVSPDAGTALPPTMAEITPGYGQLVITWSRDDLPVDAKVEVLEYTNATATQPEQVTSTFGAVHILAGRPPGETAYFRLRTRLVGGTVSDLTNLLESAAIAVPEPDPAVRAPKIVARAVTGAAWTDAEALTAIDDDPVDGDLVTLYRGVDDGTPWAETRRYDGTNWVQPNAIISGEVLLPETIPASRLKIDPDQMEATSDDDQLSITAVSADLITSGAMQSSDYVEGSEGFRIDTGGSAEFNNAVIRGLLEGSTISSSLLVASTLAVPTDASNYATTEDGKRFLTLESARPLRYRVRNITDDVLTIGPMEVEADDKSRFHDDAYNKIVSANDPYGDTDDGNNRYFTRFWSTDPKFNITLNHYFYGTNWGELVSKGTFTVVMRTESNRKLAESYAMSIDHLSQFQTAQTTARSWALPFSGGFRPGAIFTFSREVVQETSGLRRHYTKSLTISATLSCNFEHGADDAEHDGLVVEFHLDFSGNGDLSNEPINGFYYNIDLDGTTHD